VLAERKEVARVWTTTRASASAIGRVSRARGQAVQSLSDYNWRRVTGAGHSYERSRICSAGRGRQRKRLRRHEQGAWKVPYRGTASGSRELERPQRGAGQAHSGRGYSNDFDGLMEQARRVFRRTRRMSRSVDRVQEGGGRAAVPKADPDQRAELERGAAGIRVAVGWMQRGSTRCQCRAARPGEGLGGSAAVLRRTPAGAWARVPRRWRLRRSGATSRGTGAELAGRAMDESYLRTRLARQARRPGPIDAQTLAELEREWSNSRLLDRSSDGQWLVVTEGEGRARRTPRTRVAQQFPAVDGERIAALPAGRRNDRRHPAGSSATTGADVNGHQDAAKRSC